MAGANSTSGPPWHGTAGGTADAWERAEARETFFAVLGSSPVVGLPELLLQSQNSQTADPVVANAALRLAGPATWGSVQGLLVNDLVATPVDTQLAPGQRTTGPEWALVFTPLINPSNGRERQQPTIVVADSDERSRDAITVKLVQEGFLVLPVGSGRDAVNVARIPLSPIDVILLDANLPDVTAAQVVQRLQQLYLKMPAVVSTGKIGTVEREQLLMLGVRAHLPKPIQLDSLVATIRTLVRSK
jgi:CheY-like chemotaxis protein